MYRNDGSLSFTDQASIAGVDDENDGYSVQFADFDNDGDLDLHLVNNNGDDKLYQNSGGSFTDVGESQGVAYNSAGRGNAWADVDSDGDLDLYLSNFGSTNILYTNGNPTTTCLFVRPVSTNGHYTMFGATVNLYVSSTDALVATRLIDGGSGYASQNSYPAMFAALSTDTCYDIEVRSHRASLDKIGA